jgi:hypothetical protein
MNDDMDEQQGNLPPDLLVCLPIDHKPTQTPLVYAATNGDDTMLEKLTSAGNQDVNGKNEFVPFQCG